MPVDTANMANKPKMSEGRRVSIGCFKYKNIFLLIPPNSCKFIIKKCNYLRAGHESDSTGSLFS